MKQVSSTKWLHGHLIGAACDLDFVPLVARQGVDVRAALSASFAFGGSNACIALTRA